MFSQLLFLSVTNLLLSVTNLLFVFWSFPVIFNDCRIDHKPSRNFTLVTIEISVAGVITALAILAICFIIARKKHNKGIIIGSGLKTHVKYNIFQMFD